MTAKHVKEILTRATADWECWEMLTNTYVERSVTIRSERDMLKRLRKKRKEGERFTTIS